MLRIPSDRVTIYKFGPIFDMIGDIDVTLTSDLKFEYDIRYSFSVDGINFSNWFEDKESFLIEYKEMLFVKNATYVRVRIETSKFQSNENLVDYGKNEDEPGLDPTIWCEVKINGISSKPDTFEVINPNSFTVKNPAGLWTPYKHMEKAYEIWKRVSYQINEMFGHWAFYFKTSPDYETESQIFKQYGLFNVTDMKLIKISVPGNNFPTKYNNFTEFGIFLPDEFQVQILDEIFEQAFGFGQVPSENDYLYLPITGKMYSVASREIDRQFMYKSVKHDLILQVFTKAENVNDQDFNFEELINTVQIGGTTDNELEDTHIASKEFMNLTTCDAYRKYMAKTLEQVYKPLTIQGVDLFQNCYNLSSVQKSELAIEYNLKYSESEQTEEQNLYLSFWFSTGQTLKSSKLFSLSRRDQYNNIVPFAEVNIEQRKLVIRVNNKEVVATEKFDSNSMYAVAISFAGQYGVCMLTIMEYKNNTFIDHTDIYEKVGTVKIPIVGLSMFGADVIISNINLSKGIVETDMFINILTQAFPEEGNLIFDKAAKPLPESPFTM